MNVKFQLIVHRGWNLNGRENSFEGIREIISLTDKCMIEIDILTTRDDVAILFHDITLNRLLGENKTVFDLTYAELNALNPDYEIPTLEDVLTEFDQQSFLLDIRTDLHGDLFLNTEIRPEDITFNPVQKLISALKKNHLETHASRLVLQCGTLTDKELFLKHFPFATVEVAERYARDFIERFKNDQDIRFLGTDPHSVFVHIRRLSPELVNMFHHKGIRVIATPPTRDQTIEKSIAMVSRCVEVGADGIIVCPIDRDIVSMVDRLNRR